MAAMNKDEQVAFLAEPRVGVLAVEWEGRAPLSVPVWYDYQPHGDLIVWTFADSLKDRLVRAAGRFSLTVQAEDLPYRFVTVQGPVTSVERGDPEFVRTLASRYLGADRADTYIENDYEPESVTIRMSPERWLSGRYLYREEYAEPDGTTNRGSLSGA